MTDEQIIEALATNVMGLTPCRCEKNDKGYSVFRYDSETGKCNFCGNGPIPNYLTDPADSKMVRQKLAERWPWVTLTRIPVNARRSSDAEFECMLETTLDGDGETVVADADTEERAVALAALRSVGVEV